MSKKIYGNPVATPINPEKLKGGGGVSNEQLTKAVNDALELAKESGAFKGDPGERGPAGTSASLSIKYASSAWDSQEPTEWQDSVPTLTATKKYLWAQFTKTQGLSMSVWSGVVGVYGDTGPQGDPGDAYVLTEADKQTIAELAAGLVDVPGGTDEAVLLVDFTTTEDVTSVTVPSNDTESEFSELFLDIYILSTSENTAFKPVYVNMAGAQCWVLNASQNVNGRQTRMFGHLDLRTPQPIGYIRCACPVNNGVVNTGVTFNTHIWYGSSPNNTCKSINFYTQGNANIMKAGTWVKVWGIKK